MVRQSSSITITDMFCGAGGSTTGAVQAGAEVKLAINHWKRAIETHNTNYPNTLHALTDLHKANPRRFPSTTVLLASPECTSHTLAKGKRRTNQQQMALWETGEPDLEVEAEERSRCTMWTPLDWAEYHEYQAVILENVVDAQRWRPFPAWLEAWRLLGYDFEIVYLNSMHVHPTPQSRDRMYFVAWKRGNTRPNLKITPLAYCPRCTKNVQSVQSWKNPTRRYGKYRQQYVYVCPCCVMEVTPYYYAAANAIDWSLPAPRISDRAKPLQEKTLRRIAYGLEKFARSPFTVQVNKTSDRVRALSTDAFPTQTGVNGLALVSPLLMSLSHTGPDEGRIIPAGEYPIPTQTAREDLALVVPFLIIPHPAWLMTYYQNGQLVPVEEAVPTVTTLDRHALITGIGSEPIRVEDCGFRMLAPKEIQAAMAFPPDYILTGNRREQVQQLGNAVTPPVMKLLMERVMASLDEQKG